MSFHVLSGLLRRVRRYGVFAFVGVATLPAMAATNTYTTSTTWTAPVGITSVDVEVWGGGGAGGGQNLGSDGGGGGGGGAYSRKLNVAVTPGNTYTVTVGAGGTGVTSGTGNAGGDSWFINTATVLAKGGSGGAPSTGSPPAGGAGGAAASGVGDVRFSGGNGGRGRDAGTGRGGPGGSSAGTAANGTSGPDPWSTLTAAAAPTGGGIGGDGGGAGNNGNAPASGNGGGGSGDGLTRTGGAGTAGKVILTYGPTVTAITRVGTSPTNATSVQWTVTFSQSVTGVAASNFTLVNSGLAGTPAITAVSGSGTTWTVTASTGSGGTSGTLGLNATSGTGIVVSPRNLPVTGEVFSIDRTIPTVSSINRASSNPVGPATAVSWTVTFSTSVTGVDLADFVLVPAGGATGATLTSVSGSGTTWTVVANSGTGASGTLGLNLVDDDSVINGVGTPLGGAGAGNGSFTGQTYTLATPYPTLSKTASTAAAVVNDVVTFTITVTNTFGTDLNNVVVTDTMPAGMTYQASVVTLGSTTPIGSDQVQWTIPLLPAGGSAQMTLAVLLTAQGTLTNSVSAPGATTATSSVLVLASAVTHFRFDEPAGSWTGAAGEVIDSGGTGLHGKRLTTGGSTTTNTVAPSPTIASQYASVIGGFCNAGNFDGNAVVQVADSPSFDYTNKLSASAWIYPTARPSSDLYSILSNDTNYEFHLDTAGKLYWWWNYSTLTSNATIPLNQWTHIAITFSSATGAGRQKIYINGVADANTNNWTGTLQANACPFYIGGDIATGASCSLIPGRNFRGMIDEVKLYAYELSAAEVQADMNLGRLCSGTFDHLRIVHDGVASVCAPETITVKACLDATCSTLYTGNVTVNLSPTGWVGGDTFTFSGGIGSRQLSNSSSGNVTLGAVSVSPAPGGGVRCFNGSTETCTLNFAASSCAFDAVETGAAPQTRLYTKLANVPFNVDLLALSSPTTINTGYTGTVSVDLVDATASACPTGAGLTTATNVTFTGGNAGRKPISFTYPNAAKNVKVRATVGATPACSNDNFAIRPQQFAVSSSMTNATLSGTPAAAAGTNFTLTANAGVTSGYTGTPTIDATKVNDHLGAAIASGRLTGSFNPGTGAAAAGTTFKYYDVGSIQFDTDAVVDSSFSSVDQVTDCVANSTSNTLSGGKYGCNVGSVASNKFGRWYPSHYSFSGALTPACASGLYTYMGDDALGVSLTVKAHVPGSGAASASDPVATRYTYSAAANSLVVAPVTIAGDNNGTAVSVTRLTSPAFPTMPTNTLWSAGQFPISDTYAFSRLAAADGPYDLFKLTAAVYDADYPSSNPLIAPTSTGTTRVRYGRLYLGNAYGSELLPLPVPVEAQYWAGTYFATHRDDNCTSINPSSIIMSGYTQGLAACETWFSPATALTLANGRGTLTLRAPGAGNAGSVALAENIGSSASGKTCLSSTETNATAANLPGFGAVNPAARATFGVFKTPLIYRRENY